MFGIMINDHVWYYNTWSCLLWWNMILFVMIVNDNVCYDDTWFCLLWWYMIIYWVVMILMMFEKSSLQCVKTTIYVSRPWPAIVWTSSPGFHCPMFRFWACPDVQWRVCAREPSPGRRFQTAAEPRLWYFRESDQKTEANSEEDGDRHGRFGLVPQ